MAINLTSYQAALQAKLDAVTTDEKEMLLLGKAVEATIGNATVTDIQAEGTTQVNAVNTAGSTKTGEVNTAGSTQLNDVNTAGSTQVSSINNAGTTQVAAVNSIATGTFKTVGGSSILGSGDIATLPSGGTANQVLTSDASSNATWATPAATGDGTGDYNFRTKYTSGTWTAYQTGGIQVLFPNSDTWENEGGAYSTSTQLFTAPTDGVYFFHMAIYTFWNDSANGFRWGINGSSANGSGDYHNQFAVYQQLDNSTDAHVTTSTALTLSAGDTVGVYTGTPSDAYSGHSHWGGCRLKTL